MIYSFYIAVFVVFIAWPIIGKSSDKGYENSDYIQSLVKGSFIFVAACASLFAFYLLLISIVGTINYLF